MPSRRFGPKATGQRELAVVLTLAAAGICFLILRPDPAGQGHWHDGHALGLLFAAVFLALGAASWRWKPFQAALTVTDHGLSFEATGRWAVPATELAWPDIAGIEHRSQSENAYKLVILAGPQAASPGRRYGLILNGFAEGPRAILDAIGTAAEANGWRLVGPRPEALARWFDGLNWHLVRHGADGPAD